MKKFAKKVIAVVCAAVILGAAAVLPGCGSPSGDVVYFFNWQEFINPQVIDMFYEEYGITVIVDAFDSNEAMYVRVTRQGGYDLLNPSEYMVQRMRLEGLLSPLNFDNIPNFRYIDERFKNIPADPEGRYFVPYMWGTLGILYDATRVYEPVTSWSALWDERYAGQIFMYDSVRDTMAVALKKLGFSLNTTNIDELNAAVELLLEQRPLVQAFIGEPVKDAMINGEGILAVLYSGCALWTMMQNPNLNFVTPIEGSNIFVDGLVIPHNARNQEGAEKFINFLSRPDIAAMNSEYIFYTTANRAALELIDPELLAHPVFWPSDEVLDRTEFFEDLGDFRSEFDSAFTRVLIGR